jgi:hypothetical protein
MCHIAGRRGMTFSTRNGARNPTSPNGKVGQEHKNSISFANRQTLVLKELYASFAKLREVAKGVVTSLAQGIAGRRKR